MKSVVSHIKDKVRFYANHQIPDGYYMQGWVGLMSQISRRTDSEIVLNVFPAAQGNESHIKYMNK